MGSGKKCSQFLKNPLSMKFYTVLYCQCTVLIECMLLATTQLWLEYPFAFCVQIAWVAWVAWVREWRGQHACVGSWVAWVKLWRGCREWCGFIKVAVSQKQYQYSLRSVDFHYIVSVPDMYSFLLSYVHFIFKLA